MHHSPIMLPNRHLRVCHLQDLVRKPPASGSFPSFQAVAQTPVAFDDAHLGCDRWSWSKLNSLWI